MTTEPEPKFWHDLDIADEALAALAALAEKRDQSGYKKWLTTMFSGITCLARKRAQNFKLTKRQTERLQRWPEEWREQVEKTDVNRYREDLASRFLQTRKSFQYLVNLFADPSDKDWYLVSVAPRKERRNTVKLS